MLRHVVMFRLQPGTTQEAVDAMVAGLRRLPSEVPEVRAFSVGVDAGLVEGNFDVAVVADVDDADAWRRYQAHPVHVEVVTTLVRPHTAERVAVQDER